MLTVMIGLMVGLFLLNFFIKLNTTNNKKEVGFFDLSDPEKIYFFPLNSESISLEEWAKVSNLEKKDRRGWSRVFLNKTPQGWGYEDKNYRPIVMRNCYWQRRHFLVHGDLLSLENSCLQFFDPQVSKEYLTRSRWKKSEAQKTFTTEEQNSEIFRHPYLQALDQKKKPVYLDKNLIYIGRSHINDVVIRSPLIAPRQAKIFFEANRAVLVNLAADTNTFVNGRRVERAFLNNKDELSFDNQRYRFFT